MIGDDMKKGFTLVELLGVLIILSVLALLIVPNVSKYINNFRVESYEQQITSIEMAAKNWAVDNLGELPNSEGDFITITIAKLQEENYLEKNLKNPQTGKNFDTNMEIKITCLGKGYDYEVLD